MLIQIRIIQFTHIIVITDTVIRPLSYSVMRPVLEAEHQNGEGN
jgi:hypothetical protein